MNIFFFSLFILVLYASLAVFNCHLQPCILFVTWASTHQLKYVRSL